MLGGAGLSASMGPVPGPYVRRSVRRIVDPTLNCARARTFLACTIPRQSIAKLAGPSVMEGGPELLGAPLDPYLSIRTGRLGPVFSFDGPVISQGVPPDSPACLAQLRSANGTSHGSSHDPQQQH